MKKYIFGYLFVRIAKLLAVLTVLAGIGYALFKLEQASISAQSSSYQPSQTLRQNLASLKDTLADAMRLVDGFCVQSGGTTPTLPPVEFPVSLGDNDEFARLAGKLDQVDQQRHQLKETLVTRFEESVENTEAKLRAHAAAVAPATQSTALSSTVPAPTPKPTPAQDQAETLYTGQINNYDIQQRTLVLDRVKDFLKVLESSAEDASNRKTLTDSVSQLDALSHLLPAKIEAPAEVEQPVQPERSSAVPTPHQVLNAERVADQLARLRGSIRQAMLTSWTLDAAYAQTAELASSERARCRVATLTVKGVWVAAFGQVGLALLMSVFVAFLILVLADFMQTLLDTACNTGIMASATKPQP